MALYPGALARGTEPDMSKIIKLDSQFTNSHGTSEHMTIYITPGHGKQDGKAVLLLHFGTLYLAGSLS
jgi:N-acetylmuramoyl-L-alanine amidase